MVQKQQGRFDETELAEQHMQASTCGAGSVRHLLETPSNTVLRVCGRVQSFSQIHVRKNAHSLDGGKDIFHKLDLIDIKEHQDKNRLQRHKSLCMDTVLKLAHIHHG
jgi:hypothetical protein